MSTIKVPPVNRIAVIQLLVLLPVTLLIYLLDEILALSVATGALIQIGPQAFFNRMAYRFRGARQTSLILRGFYLGESGKLLMAAALFAFVFAKMPWLSYPAVFLSFLIMMIVHTLSAVLLLKKFIY